MYILGCRRLSLSEYCICFIKEKRRSSRVFIIYAKTPDTTPFKLLPHVSENAGRKWKYQQSKWNARCFTFDECSVVDEVLLSLTGLKKRERGEKKVQNIPNVICKSHSKYLVWKKNQFYNTSVSFPLCVKEILWKLHGMMLICFTLKRLNESGNF